VLRFSNGRIETALSAALEEIWTEALARLPENYTPRPRRSAVSRRK
jgi:hypothetical protein